MAKAGGLHQFSNWKRSILTDSGGFQVFSLATLRKMEPDGVRFASHIDGTRFFLGPRESMAIQRTLDSDIVMAFDECTPYPATFEQAEKSLGITTRWERMSREQPLNDGQLRFGIVQGSVYPELRKRSAESLIDIGFDGYAIGGVSVGESEPEMLLAVDSAAPYLPENAPRYLMGVGTPRQIVESVARGVDMLSAAESGNERAELALKMFARRVVKYVGAYFVLLGGVDALVFTGGVGEYSVPMRRRITSQLEALGVKLDPERNQACFGKPGVISTDDSNWKMIVMPTDEELMIARDTVSTLGLKEA